MTYNLTDEIKSKLSPEQLVIVEKWQAERKARSAIMDRVDAKEISIYDALEMMEDMITDHCEHGRSIMGTCAGCDEIEDIINPDRDKDEEDDEED